MSTPCCRLTRRPASASCSLSRRGIAVRSTSRRSSRKTFRSRSESVSRERTAAPATSSTFVAGQIARLGKAPTAIQTWALAPSASAALLRTSCSKASPPCRASTACRSSPTFMRPAFKRPLRDWTPPRSLIDKLARAGLMNDRLGIVHGVWLSPRAYRADRRGRCTRRAQSHQQSQAQERRCSDSRSSSCGGRRRARLRQLQLRREPEHLHRDADAVSVAGRDRSRAGSDQCRLCPQGRHAVGRARVGARRHDRSAQARHGGGPRDP